MDTAPRLDDKTNWTLQVIMKGLMQDPKYLEGAGYPKDLEDFLSGRASRVDVSNIEVEALDVPAEINSLFRDLKEQRNTFAASDSSEKMAYFRVATSLLEKLVTLTERANRVQQVGQFYSLVLGVFDEFLSADDILKVRQRLEGFTE
jgi:hypothetical protein